MESLSEKLIASEFIREYCCERKVGEVRPSPLMDIPLFRFVSPIPPLPRYYMGVSGIIYGPGNIEFGRRTTTSRFYWRELFLGEMDDF